MRYYGFTLNTSHEEIKANSKIKLREYDLSSEIAAVNKYMFQHMVSAIRFLAYNEEEGNSVEAVFAYDESKYTFAEAYAYILNMLEDSFLINRIKEEPYEITSYQFFVCFREAKRREFSLSFRLLEMANLRVHDDYYRDPKNLLHFEFTERIIDENNAEVNDMYDKSFVDELSNIEAHVNTSEYAGNMVHYVISSRSMEASTDMAEALMKSLYKAKRLSTKRIAFISNIDNSLHKGTNYLEEIIENNYGGAVVLDLSERFGSNPVDYKLTAEYIEKLVKKYRNKCLFVFTYNMDKPGFAYTILPQLNKYVIPVMLREGSGNRKEATNYMKKLISKSEYGEYANQAGEFMKNNPGNTFTQTDVLMAYEQFESWCLNKNILKAYDYCMENEFLLDRDENRGSAQDKLDRMIGLQNVKKQIRSIIATDVVEKERKRRSGNAYETVSMHMVFSGNPGSAKTTVAKLFAGIAKDKEILKSGIFVERSGVELGSIMSVDRIRDAFEAARGGVLFIDEAYALKGDNAITALIQEMENRREEVIVIFAGYNDRMKAFIERNEGLKSRIPYWVDFPDYSADELTEIFKLMLDDRDFTATEEAVREAHYIFDKARCIENFGNGRYVRNLVEHAIQRQSVRLSTSKKNVSDIRKKDLFVLTREDISELAEAPKKKREPGTATKELEEMIGLSSVKSVIKKVIAGAKLNKYCMEKGLHKDKASLHMVFTGNPGTAKTTVARLFAEIMKDENLLPTGNFVEVGRADLVGEYVGHTAPKVKQKFKEAQGGVLFIDEAYSLCDSYKGSFGDEAINTIVQEMENHREDTVVVFAGYPDEMQEFLDRNPGLSSRVAFHIEFDDYSAEELCDITRLMLSKKEMTITDEAIEKLKASYDAVKESKDYGNGRFVRKMLEEAEMNLAQRIYGMKEAEITTQVLTTIEACDISDDTASKKDTKKSIGFGAA